MENIDLLASKLSNGEQPDEELFRSCGAVYPGNGLSEQKYDDSEIENQSEQTHKG